ncbi:transcription factor BIM1-like isoform X1 [Salvia splendens]|uniref:transcription factor BIM1-like isoform X1 n=1 Tax=Salvia splendens TaxID=180675 RepID=UPI001C2521FE|nr:transcription factor BIM1-like isoform X1 [Salvia splendens]
MELPLGTEGRKATHDFLSLYSSSAAHTQQDPSPSQGGYLKTHDFLQPLERAGKHVTTTKEDIKATVVAVDRPPVPAPPASVEHILPGGIGTYSISYFNQMVLQPEGSMVTAQPSSTTRNDGNSNCSSSFTLWNESAVKKGKTGKENIATERHILREAGVNAVGGQWAPFMENPSQSSFNHKNNATNFSSFSSSQPSSSHQKNQSFMDMIMTSKNDQEDDDDDDDEEEEFTIKKEPSPHLKGNLSVKVEAKTIDQKPNTPRSKHSATEQRRRSKINDRFQRLREIIPNSDQKRDKASFLLEVIEYIQFLQEKVTRYDSSYNIWNREPSKMMKWQRNCHGNEGFVELARGTSTDSAPASVFGKKFDESKAVVSPSLPISGQNRVDSDLSTATTLRERVVQPPESTSKAGAVHSPMQPNIFTLGSRTTSIPASPISPKQASGVEKTMARPPSQVRSCTTDNKMPEQELTIESGTINISSAYSQGLLSTLTQALQSSGVDLSQASISVQVDLGKKANGITHSSTFVSKEDEVDATLPRSATGKESGRATKKLRTS